MTLPVTKLSDVREYSWKLIHLLTDGDIGPFKGVDCGVVNLVNIFRKLKKKKENWNTNEEGGEKHHYYLYTYGCQTVKMENFHYFSFLINTVFLV